MMKTRIWAFAPWRAKSHFLLAEVNMEVVELVIVSLSAPSRSYIYVLFDSV